MNSQMPLVLMEHSKPAATVLTGVVMDFLLNSQLGMGGHQMDLVALHGPALVLTDFTVNGVLSVGIAMFLELTLCSESLSTDVTRHWSLIAVLETNVLVQKCAQGVLLVADVALKWTHCTVLQSPAKQKQR